MSIIDEELYQDTQLREVAAKLYEHIWGDRFPDNWRIYFGVDGITIPEEKAILLSSTSLFEEYDLASLVHELIHMRFPEYKHDDTFHEEEDRATEKAVDWIATHCEGCGRERE